MADPNTATTKNSTPATMSPAGTQICAGCGQEFASRNLMFRHLRDTDAACLTGDDYQHFIKHVRSKDKGIRVLVLFGYLPMPNRIQNGDDVARILLQAMHQWQRTVDGIEQTEEENKASDSAIKYNRSYGHSQRSVDVIGQDEGTGAITEVLTSYLQPLRGGRTIDEWLDQIQALVDEEFPESVPVPVRILGRQDTPTAKRFNAEMDVSHRRVEYVLPVDFITWSNPALKLKLEALPSFSENHRHNLNHTHDSEASITDEETRIFLFSLKKLMQRLTTQVVEIDMNDKAAVMEKGFSLQKRKGKARRSKKGKKPKKESEENKEQTDYKRSKDFDPSSKVTEQHHVLRRKRFHNFTKTLMAHEYLVYRRLDRIYHRATLRFPSFDPTPVMVLSMRGDLFLTGQVCRVIGLFLALANGLIDPEIVDCVFDEDYPHLIPTPPAPLLGMVAGEVNYMTWEGKLKAILAARSTDRYPKGWNDISTLHRVKEWQDTVHQEISKRWFAQGRDKATGRLIAERDWTESVLVPWVEKTKLHLEDYRKWRQNRDTQEGSNGVANIEEAPSKSDASAALVPSLDSIDSTVPQAYEKVLSCLREVDRSGQWPTTSLKRQLVMITTADSEEAKQEEATSLSMARAKARDNKKDTSSSAYSFEEGQGGASGSFSVGIMPGCGSKPPKANSLFPELVQAAFELERAIFPDREPSSTIAVNRNAQFRPHTDSGAGAGQSTSLIVGLGTYDGGELMVEAESHDIRYKGIEFNGWKQRHWTMPFSGERYSLVWFTPKGCEGLRGIDLDLSQAIEDVKGNVPSYALEEHQSFSAE